MPDVTMPRLSDSMEEGTTLLVPAGETVPLEAVIARVAGMT
jgi:pyruvate/2-oxoglutarate dehydrogenase complex dihydrolipoamide acyltransferase (E2) component